MSTKFYAVKSPNKRDLSILEDLLKTQDNKEKFGILIGGYYYKIGEYVKAEEYLTKYYDIESKDMGINILKNYWLGKIYSKTEPYKGEMYFKNADNYKGSTDYKYFLNYFCGKKAERFIDCFKGVESFSNIKSDNRTDQTNIEEISKTNSVSSELIKQISINLKTPEIMNGLLYGIEKNRYNITISQFETAETDFGYSINDLSLIKDNKTINFAIDYKDMLIEASADDWIIQSKYIFIVVNDKNIDEGRFMKKQIDLYGIENELINFESGKLKHAYDRVVTTPETDNNTLNLNNNEETIYPNDITFVAIGEYEIAKKMIPYVRYISANPNNVKIVLITDMADTKILNEDFSTYFKGVKIYVAIDAINNENAKEFKDGYARYYAEDPDAMQYIGYDILQFLMNKNNYLTSIVKVEDNNVKRNTTCLIVDKRQATKCGY